MPQIRAFLFWEPLIKHVPGSCCQWQRPRGMNSTLVKGEHVDLWITVEHRVWINIDVQSPEYLPGFSVQVGGHVEAGDKWGPDPGLACRAVIMGKGQKETSDTGPFPFWPSWFLKIITSQRPWERLVWSSKTWKMQGWWSLSCPHLIHLDPSNTIWIMVDDSGRANLTSSSPNCSCRAERGIFARGFTQPHYVICGHWSGECSLSVPTRKEDQKQFTFTQDGRDAHLEDDYRDMLAVLPSVITLTAKPFHRSLYWPTARRQQANQIVWGRSEEYIERHAPEGRRETF